MEFKPKPIALFKSIRILKQSHNFRDSTIVVMSPSHLLVLLLKLTTRFPIVLDAGWPLSDSEPKTELSRFHRLASLKNLTIDFTSFNLSDKVLFETESQGIYSSQKFKLSKEKWTSLPTGFNEIEFEDAILRPIAPVELSGLSATEKQLIIFRGKNNKEAGIDKIIEAAKLLGENFKFVIVTNEIIYNLPSNVNWISRFISKEELVWLYQNSRVILGQFGKSNRLDRTAPHKFFEAAFFGKCYVTPRNPGLAEFADTNNVYFTKGAEPEDIVEAILSLKQDQNNIDVLALKLKNDYELKWRQTLLSKTFEEIANQFLS